MDVTTAAARPDDSLATLISQLAAERPVDGRVRLDELMERAGPRGPAFLMLFLCILSMIFSIVPGFSTLVGLPLLFLCWQMALGRKQLRLPEWLGRRTLDHDTLIGGMEKRLDYVRRAERILRPRLTLFCSRQFLRLVGLIGVICAIVLSLPIPLMNFPPTLAVFLMALGVLGKDGVFVLSGLIVAFLVVGTLVGIAIAAPHLLEEGWMRIVEFWNWLGFGASPS
jgi:hypothetical protein